MNDPNTSNTPNTGRCDETECYARWQEWNWHRDAALEAAYSAETWALALLEAVRSMAADLAAIDSNMDTTRRELLASYGLSPGQIAAVLHGPTLDTMRGILLAEREPGVES